jgi:hypothetical protein
VFCSCRVHLGSGARVAKAQKSWWAGLTYVFISDDGLFAAVLQQKLQRGALEVGGGIMCVFGGGGGGWGGGLEQELIQVY